MTSSSARADVTIAGAGILGLWQALRLARAGHRVRLIEESATPFAATASRHAGAMLAPDCEAEAAPALVRDLGHDGLQLWRETYPGVVDNGTLVVAPARDLPELHRFQRLTKGSRTIGHAELSRLEPDLQGRFETALHFEHEAHVPAPQAMTFLLERARDAGVELAFGRPLGNEDTRHGVVIDCRGMGARDALPTLRGVRGERLLLRTSELRLSRPVRLLHPRHALYVVPRGDGYFLVGATVIEREDAGRVSLRSALELMGLAYALHPAFGEAEVMELESGVRPAFPDNVPRAVVAEGGRIIRVNGAYRHGFLLAPVLAEAVTAYLDQGTGHPLLRLEGEPR